MSRAKRERKLLALLLACALLAWGTAALAAGQGCRTETGYAAVQLAAADLLEDCFRQVRTYKEELGIPLSELDYHQTGMIGESYTGITTTLGAIEAKRTTAWPEMGALCVRLLHEAGVRSGDTVGAGFSGSFPAMDLAVIAACQVMGVELIYISSVGASTYGANHPALTFPEMAHRLVEDGRKHGTIGVVTEGGVLEMTTFRTDGEYRDHRHPESVQFVPDLREDLARRDFTVNAMALSCRGELRDPFGGQADLAARLLRCVGDPCRRFREDALRILRCARFASELGFRVEEATFRGNVIGAIQITHRSDNEGLPTREKLSQIILAGIA